MNHIRLVKDLLAEIRPGATKSEGALSLVPLFGARPAGDYFLAAEAFGFGLLAIEEVGGGEVPNIALVNRSELPVLVVDGEHLEGARQNRITNVTVMVAPNSKTILPVSCVEQGRWHFEARPDFSTSPDHAYARVRRVQAESSVMAARRGGERRASQGAVWDDVARKHHEMGVAASPSGAMRDAYDARRGDLARLMEAFARPAPEQTGIVACIGGAPVALDLFDKPDTLTKMWTRLVTGYAVDAYGAPERRADGPRIEAFLSAARAADLRGHEAVGLGMDVTLVGPRIVGGGLAWDGGVPHLSLFPRENATRDGRGIASPSQRRRSRSYFRGASS